MEYGNIEFKCHGCGKFASTDTCKKPNNPENFEVTCNKCDSHEWTPMIQDVDGDYQEEATHIQCNNCKSKTFELSTTPLSDNKE
jgi:Zn finger protein HypA/HybF involved in hydrogenase expression